MLDTPNTTEREAVFDIALVDSIVPMWAMISSWSGGWKRPPYILARLDHIATDKFSPHAHTGKFTWFDPRAGKGGVGAVALVAHVLKIHPGEAARRIVSFLAPASLADQQRHLEYLVDVLSKGSHRG